MAWQNLSNIGSHEYSCGYCNNLVASTVGYFYSKSKYDYDRGSIYICPHCKAPTFFSENYGQVPDTLPGNNVLYIPSNLGDLYSEARKSVSIGAYTGSVLLCRKLLMNIAVSLGAEEGKQFIVYVDYLANQGYIPPNGRGWVDHIRKKGNEATHEIALMNRQDAEELISFAEMLMKFIYEFPNRIP